MDAGSTERPRATGRADPAPPAPAAPAGLDELFLAVLPELRRGVHRIAADTEDSDELLQELYLRLRCGRAGRRFLAHPNPVGYSAVIMRNMLRDRWRQRHRAQSVLSRIARPEDLHWDGGLRLRESELEVVGELRLLSERQAAAVSLIDIDGYTLDAAATLLGVHRGSLHRHRLRALEKLRNRLPEGMTERAQEGEEPEL